MNRFHDINNKRTTTTTTTTKRVFSSTQLLCMFRKLNSFRIILYCTYFGKKNVNLQTIYFIDHFKILPIESNICYNKFRDHINITLHSNLM